MGFYAYADDVNNSGSITLHDDWGHSYIYEGQTLTDLGFIEPHGNQAYTRAYSINDLSAIVGRASDGNNPAVATVYSSGQITSLGTLGAPYGNSSSAHSINNAGQAVGYSITPNGSGNHAVLFYQGSVNDLGTLGGNNSVANCINNLGQVVGYSDTQTNQHAFLYSDGIMQDLHTTYLPGWQSSIATSINDRATIVGYGINADGELRSWQLVKSESTTTFTAIQDTYIKDGQPNKNQGTEQLLRVRQSGKNRSLVLFDNQEIADFVQTRTIVSAKLRLYITSNGNNWGTSGREVAIHRLDQAWTEIGATWNCPNDTNTGNNSPDGPTWEMDNSNLWPFSQNPTSTYLHKNGVLGWVEWDVTIDVRNYLHGSNINFGWIIKKVNEGQSGSVEYSSREGQYPPILEITAR